MYMYTLHLDVYDVAKSAKRTMMKHGVRSLQKGKKNTSKPNFLSKINYFRYVTVKLDPIFSSL